MDRQIVYPGSIPLDTDLLNVQVNALIALGFLAQSTLGTGTVVDGLAISQSTVADMNVHIGPGSIVQLSTVDSAAFGSLASNSAALMKMGINTGSTTFALAAPGTAGQSINYLIEATLAEVDGSPVVLPYYNASNPAVPYSGPSNSGAAQNTRRAETVSLQLKAGTPATTGTQTTPAVDAGWVGLYVVTVAYGQTSITTANLSGAKLASAPFIAAKIPALAPLASPSFTGTPGITNAGANALLGLTSFGGSGRNWQVGSNTDGTFTVYDNTGAAIRLSISATGAVTFSGTVTAPNGTSGTQVVNYSQFNPSNAANGYCYLPGGIIMQWGTTGALPTGANVETIAGSFPLAFPTGCYSITGTPDNVPSGTWTALSAIATALSASGFTFTCDTGNTGQTITNTVHIRWIAFGH